MKTLILALMLSGCVSTVPLEIKNYSVNISIRENVEDKCGTGNAGCIFCLLGKCNIYSIPRSDCLQHELDHLLYKDWHNGRPETCDIRAL